MAKDLTSSRIDRHNILNNELALKVHILKAFALNKDRKNRMAASKIPSCGFVSVAQNSGCCAS